MSSFVLPGIYFTILKTDNEKILQFWAKYLQQRKRLIKLFGIKGDVYYITF